MLFVTAAERTKTEGQHQICGRATVSKMPSEGNGARCRAARKLREKMYLHFAPFIRRAVLEDSLNSHGDGLQAGELVLFEFCRMWTSARVSYRHTIKQPSRGRASGSFEDSRAWGRGARPGGEPGPVPGEAWDRAPRLGCVCVPGNRLVSRACGPRGLRPPGRVGGPQIPPGLGGRLQFRGVPAGGARQPAPGAPSPSPAAPPRGGQECAWGQPGAAASAPGAFYGHKRSPGIAPGRKCRPPREGALPDPSGAARRQAWESGSDTGRRHNVGGKPTSQGCTEGRTKVCSGPVTAGGPVRQEGCHCCDFILFLLFTRGLTPHSERNWLSLPESNFRGPCLWRSSLLNWRADLDSTLFVISTLNSSGIMSRYLQNRSRSPTI